MNARRRPVQSCLSVAVPLAVVFGSARPLSPPVYTPHLGYAMKKR